MLRSGDFRGDNRRQTKPTPCAYRWGNPFVWTMTHALEPLLVFNIQCAWHSYWNCLIFISHCDLDLLPFRSGLTLLGSSSLRKSKRSSTVSCWFQCFPSALHCGSQSAIVSGTNVPHDLYHFCSLNQISWSKFHLVSVEMYPSKPRPSTATPHVLNRRGHAHARGIQP